MSAPSVKTIYRDTHFAFNLETNWEEAWDNLVKVYNHPSRVYHNFSHIEEMVLWLWENYPMDSSIWAILYAAFYHDYVDTKSKTTEIDSATMALEHMVGEGSALRIGSLCSTLSQPRPRTNQTMSASST